MYKIIEKEKDIGGQWRVRVLLNENESAFFTFREEPTEDQIQIVAEKFVENQTINNIANNGVIAVNPEKVAKVLAMREQYRIATRSLCELANFPITDKLEDVDYLNVRIAAAQNDFLLSTVYTETIAYCLNTLRLDDGRDAWDRI